MKHKIGKREHQSMQAELLALNIELEKLNQKDTDGFIPFYDDVESNHKKVERKNWLTEVLNRGFYYKWIQQ